MAGTYISLSDIVAWIDDWQVTNSTPTDADVASFADKLIEKIGQMDFRASNEGAAIGYAGTIGDSTGVFKTIEEITKASNGDYSFINNGAENIQNQPEFWKSLEKVVDTDSAIMIMGGAKNPEGTRLTTSFGIN